MKISDMINKLEALKEQHGDVDVLINAPDGMFEANKPTFCEVEEDDEYPKSWNMPKGFRFVQISVL